MRDIADDPNPVAHVEPIQQRAQALGQRRVTVHEHERRVRNLAARAEERLEHDIDVVEVGTRAHRQDQRTGWQSEPGTQLGPFVLPGWPEAVQVDAEVDIVDALLRHAPGEDLASHVRRQRQHVVGGVKCPVRMLFALPRREIQV